MIPLPDDVKALINLGHEIGTPTFIEFIIVNKKQIIDPTISHSCPSVALESCQRVIDLDIQRDLFDPSSIDNVRHLVNKKFLSIDNYIPFVRKYDSGILVEVQYDYVPVTKESIVVIHTDVTGGLLQRVADYLVVAPQILPARMIWPNE